MWKLTIEDDEGTKTLLPLVRDEYHVGRDEKCTIRLTERNISRKHATLKKNGGAAWHILDHDSYNGCYVNGQRVAGDFKLSHSDVIQLGDYRIFITNDAVTDTDASQGMGGPATSPSINVSFDKPDRLVVLAGPDIGAEYPLNQGSITIGRAEECTVSINHPSVSRVHAEIKPLGAGRYEIFDRGSSNGLRVNGTEFRRTLLEGGDLLELGDVKMRFVERGQIYRPHADMTQQLSALTRVPTVARPGAVPKASGKTGILIGAGAAGLLVVMGLVAFSLSGKADSPTEKSIVAIDDASTATLEAARKAYNGGDYAGAVQKLGTLPEGSPAWSQPEVGRMYARWAESSLTKAKDAGTSDAEKRKLLEAVAQDTHVPAELRKQASDLLAKLDATPTTDPNALPSAPTVAAPALTIDLTTPPSKATAGAAAAGDAPGAGKPLAKKEPKEAAADKPAAPAGGGADPLAGQDGEMKMRRVLEGKMNSGKATKDDLRMLKAICQHQSDASCKSRANDALKKAQLGGAGGGAPSVAARKREGARAPFHQRPGAGGPPGGGLTCRHDAKPPSITGLEREGPLVGALLIGKARRHGGKRWGAGRKPPRLPSGSGEARDGSPPTITVGKRCAPPWKGASLGCRGRGQKLRASGQVRAAPLQGGTQRFSSRSGGGLRPFTPLAEHASLRLASWWGLRPFAPLAGHASLRLARWWGAHGKQRPLASWRRALAPCRAAASCR